MKKIFIGILVLIFFPIAYYFLHLHVLQMSESYVEKKKNTLQKEFYDKLNEYWAGESRLMYSEEYGSTSYVPMDMDAVQFIDNRNEKDATFYSSVERLFPYDRFPLLTSTMFKCLRPGCFRELYELNAVKNMPWRAFLLKYQEKDKFQMFIFKPVAVGYLQSSYNLRDWRPSLDESCTSALEYLIKEDRNYKDCYNQNNKKTINKILSLYNRYYYLQTEGHYQNFEDNNYVNFENIKLSPNPEGEPLCGHRINWIYNGFYRVYYDTYPLLTYEVTFNHLNYNNDKETYYTEHFFVVKICFWTLFFILFVYLSYLIYRFSKYRSTANSLSSKINIEPDISYLYNEIITKANLLLFIEPYQPNKLTTANEIYSEALKNKHNRDVLKKLLDRIKKEL